MKNLISQKILDEIPKSNSLKSKAIRRNVLERELAVLRGQSFRNRYLSAPVICLDKTIDEIVVHSSKSYLSTLAALHLKQAIIYSSVLYVDLPKSGKQMKTFGAWITIILHCNIEGVGNAKLTLVDSLMGHPKKGVLNLSAYCLTKQKETVS